MIRHNALVPLSHDHHLGLMAAVRLKRGDAAYKRSRSIAESVEELWRTELAGHFEQEEECLFTLEVDAPTRAMIERAIDEHRRMRALVEQIAAGAPDDVARELGTLLESHIRFEERELFEALQAQVDEARLARAGDAIAAGRTPRACSSDDPGH